MSIKNTSFNFVGIADKGEQWDNGRVSGLWARLEQIEDTTDSSEASLNDMYQMLATVMGGNSAYDYVQNKCPYVTKIDDNITIELEFYVWVSDIDLAYSIKADIGDLLSLGVGGDDWEFDVPFNGTSVAQLDKLFIGSFKRQMPYFTPTGTETTPPKIELIGPDVVLDKPLVTVLRGVGTSKGFRYKSVMRFTKPDKSIIDNITNIITLSYVDIEGESVVVTMTLRIPDCVKDILTDCGTDRIQESVADEDIVTVYYSTCTGEVLDIVTKEGE